MITSGILIRTSALIPKLASRFGGRVTGELTRRASYPTVVDCDRWLFAASVHWQTESRRPLLPPVYPRSHANAVSVASLALVTERASATRVPVPANFKLKRNERDPSTSKMGVVKQKKKAKIEKDIPNGKQKTEKKVKKKKLVSCLQCIKANEDGTCYVIIFFI